MPIRPLGRQTRSSSPTMPSWPGIEMASPADSTTSKELSGRGRSSALPSRKATSNPSAWARSRLQPLGDVDADDSAEAAGGGQRGAAATAGHVQHPRTGVEIDGLAEQLADEQGARPDGGVAH